MSAALEVRNLTKTFGKLKAVDDVSFEVQAGEVVGFIGPNGAGKTTTMRICSTLELPDHGDVFIEGRSVLQEPRATRHRLGFMPDAYGAYNATSVFEYLDFFARAYDLRGRARRSALAEVMDFTGLVELQEKLTSSLSKGMRQRLCLAKTLLHDPRVLILDEPAAGLDPRARIELRELLRALAEMGKAILISSHILTELAEICDGVAILEAGRLCAEGDVDEVVGAAGAETELFLRCLESPDEAERRLVELPGVRKLRPAGDGVIFEWVGTDEEQAELLAMLIRMGLHPIELACKQTDLEDVFLRLTEGRMQ